MCSDSEIKNRYPDLPPDPESWDHRFDEAEEKMGKEAADAIRRLYDFYGRDFYLWLAELYDESRGAFYYANSSRDNEGFLPDCESTCQALAILKRFGMFPRIGDGIPVEDRPKLAKFISDMQDPDDGYFYHQQWGKDVGSSRKGRDLTQCLELLREMNASPKYPTALERLAAIAERDVEQDDTPMPKHLLSRENMLEYLDELCKQNSHSVGHTLSSQVSQIKAVGMCDLVCDYLDGLQNPETGLWDAEPDYTSMSGIIKIGAFYGGAGRRINHADKLIDSAMDVICSEVDPLWGIYVFNPWGALGAVVQTYIEDHDGDPEVARETYARVYRRVPEMIDATIRKIGLFRKPDGSFSYFQDKSAPTTQGVPVSLGLYEGDVNGTAVAVNYLTNSLLAALGLPIIPMFNENDRERFMNALKKTNEKEA
jgi:hypothetical protein